MPQALKIPDAKAAVEKECEKLEKIPAWQLTKVRNKKEVIDEATNEGSKVHFVSLMDICNDSCKSHGRDFKTTWLRRTNNRRSIRLHARSKWKMHQRYFKNIQSQNVQIFGYVYHSTKSKNHGPIWKTQSFLLNEICMVILWQDYYGKDNLRKFYWSTVAGKIRIGNVYPQIGNVSSVHRQKGLFSSVYVDAIKIGWKETKSLIRGGKY